MKKYSILILSSLLYGCTTDVLFSKLINYKWIPPENTPTIVYNYHDTTEQVTQACIDKGARTISNGVIAACATVYKDTNKCVLDLPNGAPQSYITHELLHCSGWKHEIIEK